MQQNELDKILKLHKMWLDDHPEVQKADFSAMDLSGWDLSGADFSGADLRGADLSGADLSKANLWESIFTDVKLQDAK